MVTGTDHKEEDASGQGAPHFAYTPAFRRVAVAMVFGTLVGVGTSFVSFWQAAALIGWDAAAAVFLLWVWLPLSRMTAHQVREHASREDPNVALADLVVLGACVAFLAAVGVALVKASGAHGGTKAFLIGIAMFSVALSWGQVHTVFTLRYARLYYSLPVGGIDFNHDDSPEYADFAYLAFTVGMTFQVSDTDLTSKTIRRVVLRQMLLSYLFGAVILGLAINVVGSILQ
jgi:uncharacterized membrane protein